MKARKVYTTDLTEAEWQRIEPWVPAAKPGGRPAKYNRREIVNAILYLLRSGCSWRLLPPDLPPWRIVFYYFWSWRKAGVWARLQDILDGELQQAAELEWQSSAAIIHSQKGGRHEDSSRQHP